jgi:hypothetical protein
MCAEFQTVGSALLSKEIHIFYYLLAIIGSFTWSLNIILSNLCLRKVVPKRLTVRYCVDLVKHRNLCCGIFLDTISL